MPPKVRKTLPLVAAVVLALGVGVAVWVARDPAPPAGLADLGKEPRWERLADYAGCMTRSRFEELLAGPFSLGEAWRKFVTVGPRAARVRTTADWIEIPFAEEGAESAPPRYWRPVAEMPPAPPERPLEGIRIAIDPGHLGGDFAVMEERWYRLGEDLPVTEGDMTLRVAKLLEPRLAALGAEVTLVRRTAGPVNDRTVEDLRRFARLKMRTATPSEIRRLSERLFYRTAEIRERARRINAEIRPDLVLCLHFNAEAWGDPKTPRLLDRNHFHIILNGAYLPGEIAHHDERFEMLERLLQGIHSEEAALGTVVAAAFAEESGLPPYTYRSDASALPVEGSPYLWIRNLLANRLYRCPVLFMEPYVMNNREVYERIQAGDYEGTRLVAGRERKSIYREYADGLADGLRRYYEDSRLQTSDF